MRPAELLALAATAARTKPAQPPATGDADAFARALDTQLRQTAPEDGPCGTTGAVTTAEADAAAGATPRQTPVRGEGGMGSLGLEHHLAQLENRAARTEWRAFLQELRDAGLLGTSRWEAPFSPVGPNGKSKSTATDLVAGDSTSSPKPGPQTATPFGEALDVLGAAIQAAIADPAANPAAPGQLPVAVQSALDAAAALAPPAIQARMAAFTSKLAEGLAAAMAEASGETPATSTAETGKSVQGFESPVAQAILAAVSGAGEGADLSALRALQDKVAAARAQATASAPAADTPDADSTTATPADAAPAIKAKVADASAQVSAGDAAAREPVATQAARTAEADVTPSRAELASPTTPASSAPAAETHAATLVATRGAPELVAQMAAVISRKLEGRVTRFNMELNPAEMGRVDVRLNIDKDGRVAAQMSFDNPAAAADMRGKADELRRQLELSGFNVASEDLTFSDRGAGQEFQRRDQALADPDISRARAFREADRNARLAEDAGRLSSRATLGLDMRV